MEQEDQLLFTQKITRTDLARHNWQVFAGVMRRRQLCSKIIGEPKADLLGVPALELRAYFLCLAIPYVQPQPARMSVELMWRALRCDVGNTPTKAHHP